ncbi:hypothetical protein [Floricoccus penangensis]|uniref:hypothetical protein n=1 Tax=Floricoccus penangensis TaxID=1859475 RepID=UPI00203AB9C6|nr:hypothetical protein [Floricoccus penangensis]URZ88141.1 DUF443 family protein [Floricoccus penangensis]
MKILKTKILRYKLINISGNPFIVDLDKGPLFFMKIDQVIYGTSNIYEISPILEKNLKLKKGVVQKASAATISSSFFLGTGIYRVIKNFEKFNDISFTVKLVFFMLFLVISLLIRLLFSKNCKERLENTDGYEDMEYPRIGILYVQNENRKKYRNMRFWNFVIVNGGLLFLLYLYLCEDVFFAIFLFPLLFLRLYANLFVSIPYDTQLVCEFLNE